MLSLMSLSSVFATLHQQIFPNFSKLPGISRAMLSLMSLSSVFATLHQQIWTSNEMRLLQPHIVLAPKGTGPENEENILLMLYYMCFAVVIGFSSSLVSKLTYRALLSLRLRLKRLRCRGKWWTRGIFMSIGFLTACLGCVTFYFTNMRGVWGTLNVHFRMMCFRISDNTVSNVISSILVCRVQRVLVFKIRQTVCSFRVKKYSFRFF